MGDAEAPATVSAETATSETWKDVPWAEQKLAGWYCGQCVDHKTMMYKFTERISEKHPLRVEGICGTRKRSPALPVCHSSPMRWQ